MFAKRHEYTLGSRWRDSTHSVAVAVALSFLFTPTLAPAAAPTGRFVPSGGTVLDKQTGLTWQQAPAPMTYTWANAMTYCSGNVAALPGSGWRLPAIKELQALVDDSVAAPGPTIDTSAFPSTPAAIFWSSTPAVQFSSANAWSVYFDNGSTYPSATGTAENVRCVR